MMDIIPLWTKNNQQCQSLKKNTGTPLLAAKRPAPHVPLYNPVRRKILGAVYSWEATWCNIFFLEVHLIVGCAAMHGERNEPVT